MPKLAWPHCPQLEWAQSVKAFKENTHAICRSWSRSSFGGGGSCVSARASLGRARLRRRAGAQLRRAARLLLLEESLASRPVRRAEQWILCARAVHRGRHHSWYVGRGAVRAGLQRPLRHLGSRTLRQSVEPPLNRASEQRPD